MEPKDKHFLFWDGEGVTETAGEPQNFVLFGHHKDPTPLKGKRLHTLPILDYIMTESEDYNDTHIHVAFAFDYDVNMILGDLTVNEFQTLRKTNRVRYCNYMIEHIPHKWLRITRANDGQTILIQDMFSFFQTSFIRALDSYLPAETKESALYQKVVAGKASRNLFTYDDMESIESYWRAECGFGAQLAEQLRNTLYRAGFFITKWHGPGALANYLYQTNRIKLHKDAEPEQVYTAARHAYAGGRFELFQLGRHTDVYGYDINSAYPEAITTLPSLTEGEWRWNESPTHIQPFGVYHFRSANFESVKPGPTFFRDSRGNITFPWCGDFWSWSPEAEIICGSKRTEILGGWEYVGWESQPFTFVEDMYNTRLELKKAKRGEEKAYKLGLNSLYGKMAQRTGWERTQSAPTWHALSWAGYVTSYTRAKLYRLMLTMPLENLIAVETDGLYCTAPPEQLGVTHSEALGGWDVTHYSEMLYLQSGVYSMHNEDGWKTKYRGLNPGTLTHQSMAQILRECTSDGFPPIVGNTTRFTGYRAALMLRQDNDRTLTGHRVWQTSPKSISLGHHGKRYHNKLNCRACLVGADAYDMPHLLSINPIAQKEIYSQPHDIPWLDADFTQPEWRDLAAMGNDMLKDWDA